MSKNLILRVAWVMAVVATAACNNRSSLAPNGGDASVGGDAFVGGDAATDASQPPRLDLPGIVVWLDGDVGIDTARTDVTTWTDRSAYRHVFMAQSADGDMPAIAQLNGHGAVRFNGRNRFISEYAPSAAQKDALALGGTFVVAIVFVPAGEATHSTILTLAMLPWIASPPEPDVMPPPSSPTFSILTQVEPSARSFQAGASSLRVGDGFAPSPQRLILSTEGGNPVRVRLNGQAQTGTPAAVDGPSDGSYAPIYLGSWDFDSWGFEGAVAEMVIVRGAADSATEQALDDYLKLKFSL
jgi:hypothetical protein